MYGDLSAFCRLGSLRLLHHKPLRVSHYLMLGISLVILLVSVFCFICSILGVMQAE
jgi:hypothetical protein